MSIQAMVHYLDREDLKGNEKLCMVILGDNANDEAESFPGHKTIARRLSMTESGARKLLYRLRDKGEIVILERQGIMTKFGATNRYRLLSYLAQLKGVPSRTPLEKQVSQNEKQVSQNEKQVSPARDTDPLVLDPLVLDPPDPIGTATPVQPTLIDEQLLSDQPQPETPAQRNKRLGSHEAVKAYRECYNRSMRKVTYASVQHIENIERWKSVMHTWKLRGYNPGNIDGQLDWYENGIPKRGPKGKPKFEDTSSSDNDAWRKDWSNVDLAQETPEDLGITW